MKASYQFDLADTREWLPTLERHSVSCAITSPPYWALRDYGHPTQIGLEETLEEHLAELVQVFREVHRALHPMGTLWINYGDAWAQPGRKPTQDESERKRYEAEYQRNEERAKLKQYETGAYSCTEFRRASGTCEGSGLPPKSLMLLPHRLAIALQEDGWILRSEIIWHKPYDGKALKDYNGTRAETPGDVKSRILKSLVRRKCVGYKSGCACYAADRTRATVIDPFAGTATTGVVSLREGRSFVGVEASPEYHRIGMDRLGAAQLNLRTDEYRNGQLSFMEALEA